MVELTKVYDDYWRFAAERQAVYERRLVDSVGPWTGDTIISSYRFTNPYRAADRVSQYLIRHVQYDPARSQEPGELFFRTMLFKLFNKVSTWEAIEKAFGPMSWSEPNADFDRLASLLDELMSAKQAIYSAAYIMPSPPLGFKGKHRNHLALLSQMMYDELPKQLQDANNLEEAFELILDYPGIGPFLAFQYAIDLNYSTLINFEESSFVVAGPGALDGIAKCFAGYDNWTPESICHNMADIQEREFERLGLTFNGLFGRRLQPIDCQNLFCEISKYARIKHPDVVGTNDRTKIKQGYKPAGSMPVPMFPPKWRLTVPNAN
jgi:hypothetical protein